MTSLNIISPLISRQLRQHRGLFVTVLLLTLLAGALGNLGIVFGVKYPHDFAARLDEIGTEHINLAVTDEPARDQAVDMLQSDPRVTEVVTQPTNIAVSTISYNGADTTVVAAFVDQENVTSLGQSQVVEHSSRPVDNPIYVPLMLSTGGNYSLGDPLTVTFSGTAKTFHIQGFTENGFGGTLSMGTLVLGLPHDEFAKFSATPDAPTAGWFVRARVSDTGKASEVLNAVTGSLSNLGDQKNQPVTANWPLDWNLLISGLSAGAAIYAALLVGFAVLLALVAALVVSVTLRNAIMNDIVSIGVQRALGYTTTQIAASILVPVTTVSLIGAFAGLAVSYMALPPLAAGLVAQTGLRWPVGFSWSGLAVVPVVGVICALAVGLTTLAIRNYSAVTALRGGQTSHTFQPTILPLASTPGPLACLMGLKMSARTLGQNLTVTVIIAVSTFASLLGTTMYTELATDQAAFARMTVGRMQDLIVHADADANLAALRTQVEALDGIEGVYTMYLTEGEVNGVGVGVTVAEDFDLLPPPSIIYDGRDPVHDNEIALGGNVAEQLGVGVGDTVTLSIGQGARDMLVTGLTQSTQRLGMTVEATSAAVDIVVPGHSSSELALWLNPGVSASAVADSVQGVDGVVQVERLKESVDSQLAIYLTMVRSLAISILTLTGIFVALVTALSAMTALTRSRHSMRISKALGFSNAQLIGQLVVSYLPAAVGGALLGAVLAVIGVKPALLLMLRSAGIMKLDLAIDPATTVAVCLVVASTAIIMTWLMALRVRRIQSLAH